VKKIAQIGIQVVFCQNLYVTFSVAKNYPEDWAIFCVLFKRPNENNRPMGENSPILVILFSKQPSTKVTKCSTTLTATQS
jgi:hypothetical protein